MRHVLVRAALLALALSGATLAYAYSTGPPASRTGAFAVLGRTAEPNCSICHSGQPLNDPAGSLQILGIPAHYVPGQTYPITVELDYAWNPLPPTPVKWGFELQAVQASTGDSVGVWDLSLNVGPDTVRVINGLSTSIWRYRRYVEHVSASTRTGLPGPVTWTINWVAPPGDSGKIYFFAAGNAANGDGQSSLTGLDHIFTTADSSLGGGITPVPHPGALALRTALEPPFPNPLCICTDITYTVSAPGLVDVSIYDVSGRKVRTKVHEHREIGSYGTFWDGRFENGTPCPNGVYFVRLSAPGRAGVLSRRIVLKR